jgi:hypothetical protein
MQDSKSKKFSFHVLEENDIEDCADLISNVYVNFNPLINSLKCKPSDLKVDAKKLLSKILEDKLTMVAKDPKGKIIGCWAGVKLTKIFPLESNQYSFRKDLCFDLDVEKMSHQEKTSIWTEVEYILMKEIYENLVVKKEEDQAYIGKFYCISPDYFGTSLVKDFVFYYTMNAIQRGVKHFYGAILNIKLVNIFTKHLPIKIFNKCKVTLAQANRNLHFDTFLFYCDVDNGNSLLSKF